MIKIYPHAEIKNKWKIWVEESTVITLVFLIAMFYYFPDINSITPIREFKQEIVTLEQVEITRQEVKPPPPPAFTRMAVSDNPDIEEAEINFNSELDVNANVAATILEPPKVELSEEDAPIFEIVEELPEPIGGISTIQKNIIYPDLAKKAGLEGLVIIRAAIDVKGNVIKTQILKGIGGGCDEAAAEAVQKTKFKPGSQRGFPVRVWVSVPVRFKLRG